MNPTPINRVQLVLDDIPNTPRDKGLSLIRTAVPVAWGFLLTFLATRLPFAAVLLDNPHVYALVDAAVTTAWYALWRWTEAHLPAWLTTLVLGANTRPVYALPPAN